MAIITYFILLSLIILDCNGQLLISSITHKVQSVNSLLITEVDRYYTKVIVKNGICGVTQCFFNVLTTTEKLLAIVHDEKNSNCSIILATSTIVNNKTDGSYTDDHIYVSYDYDKILDSVKPFKYPSSCQPDVPLPTSTYTLLQQRIDGCLSFTKVWTEYANGFGHPTGNYWVGLELMHLMTWPDGKRLRLEMKKFNDSVIYVAEYSSFKVGPSSDKYRLHISGYDNGVSTAGNSMNGNINNMNFSTTDSDNDIWSGSCSNVYAVGTGWWFIQCGSSNLNGNYSDTRVLASGKLYWYYLDDHYALDKTKMMIYN